MSKITTKSFKGGLRFKRYQGTPAPTQIDLPLPARAVVLLKQGFGSEVPLTVKPGDPVKAGQIIGRDDTMVSNPVHATLNGRVESVIQLGTEEDKNVTAVTIDSDGTAGWQKLDGAVREWEALTLFKLEELVYLSGAAGLDEEGLPTRFQSALVAPERVEHLVISDLDTGLYNTVNINLRQEQAPVRFWEGVRILTRIMPKAVIYIALAKNQKGLLKRLTSQNNKPAHVNFYLLDAKFPQGTPRLLIQTILNKKLYGLPAAHFGITVLKSQTVLQVAEAVTEGKPVIEKTVALCGAGFKRNTYAKIRIGAVLGEALKEHLKPETEIRLLLGNVLQGRRADPSRDPLTRPVEKIIALPEYRVRDFMAFMRPGFRKGSFSRTFLNFPLNKACNTNRKGDPRACVFCNFCDTVCPAGILPFLIYQSVERNFIGENLIDLRIFDCVDCNLCSHVCPSKIRVAEYIREGKQQIIAQSEYFPAVKTMGIDAEKLQQFTELK